MGTRRTCVCWMIVVGGFLLWRQLAQAEISNSDLNTSRNVQEREWLALKLEVMSLRLSYPAYRINLEISPDNAIVFTFLASGGLAEHLSELGPTEAKQMLAYHGSGIRDKVNDMIKDEFSSLWTGFDTEEDFAGRFLVPADDWDEPPKELASWVGDRFQWNP